MIDTHESEYPPERLASIRDQHLQRVKIILSSVERFRPPKRSATGRPFMLNSKCYVGGKAIDNRGGNTVDL